MVGLGNVTNESKATMFASPTLTGSITASGTVSFEKATYEFLDTKTGATGTVSHLWNTSAIWWHTNISSDFTANLVNVPQVPKTTVTMVLVLTQGTTAYMPTVIQVNSVELPVLWAGGVAPSGTPNGVDVLSFTVFWPFGQGADPSSGTLIGSATSYG